MLAAPLIALLFHPIGAAADTVVSSDAVRDRVVLRAGPTSSSDDIGGLRPGEKALYLGQVPGWIRARLDDGTEGYLSKRWVDVTADLPSTPFALEAIDVGTGLAVIIQGPDFVLLYDAGSNDDLGRRDKNRVLAYLKATRPGLDEIDHVVVSHPHRDHVELLPDVLVSYRVRAVWDSGALSKICGYRALLTALRDNARIEYHTANRDPGNGNVRFDAASCYGVASPAQKISLTYASRINNVIVPLGQDASMWFLHADGSDHGTRYNENSLVVRVNLGDKRVLLMGDAEAGGRSPPSTPPDPDSIEGKLLACCRSELKSDVLVVGHHGSKTSSRKEFLDVVDAEVFIVSSGPKKYGPVTLPDPEIIAELRSRGQVFRTDLDDPGCAQKQAKIGPDTDGKPGGCENVRVAIQPGVPVTASYWTGSD